MKLNLIVISALIDSISCQRVITLAGSGVAGTVDGQGTFAQLDGPSHIIPDNKGNFYIIEQSSCRIRMMDSSFYVKTLAGKGCGVSLSEGQGTTASFRDPRRGYVDVNGDLYVADSGNHRIRKITSTGWVSTFVGTNAGSNDGSFNTAKLRLPNSVIADRSGFFYSVDNGRSIRKISPSSQSVITLAGDSGSQGFLDGSGTSARFDAAQGLTLDFQGNLYTADAQNFRIRKIAPDGYVSTFPVGFSDPEDLVIDPFGNMFVVETSLNLIKKMDLANQQVTTFAGSGIAGSADGEGLFSTFKSPVGITTDFMGNLYIADQGSNKVRVICNNTCPPGFWLPTTGCCQPCSSGFYQPSPGQKSCLPCPMDSVCSPTGFTMIPKPTVTSTTVSTFFVKKTDKPRVGGEPASPSLQSFYMTIAFCFSIMLSFTFGFAFGFVSLKLKRPDDFTPTHDSIMAVQETSASDGSTSLLSIAMASTATTEYTTDSCNLSKTMQSKSLESTGTEDVAIVPICERNIQQGEDLNTSFNAVEPNSKSEMGLHLPQIEENMSANMKHMDDENDQQPSLSEDLASVLLLCDRNLKPLPSSPSKESLPSIPKELPSIHDES